MQIFAGVRHHGFRIRYNKTRQGKHGVLVFPGVVIVRGRIQPQGGYVEKFARDFASMTVPQKLGHAGFLNQFGRNLFRKMRERLVPKP
jgi:hypothetical protein